MTKNDPKAMKAKAGMMLKSGAISDAQHKKLCAKADVELTKSKPVKAAPSVAPAVVDAVSDEEAAPAAPVAAKPAGRPAKPVAVAPDA